MPPTDAEPREPSLRDQIIAEIRRLAEANDGQPPGVLRFERETDIRESAWRGVYWARWGDALIEAGYSPNGFQGKYDTDHIFLKFIEACRHFARIPTVDELKMFGRSQANFPAATSFHTHFGTKSALIENLRAWVTGRESFEDIAAMLGNRAEPDAARSPAREGLVYLIKSGPHYKIGRSDELERRVKEIRIALPEAASLVHSIRTDDPAGIEAYWHRRFADRRANGEWFKLSTADVAAFKRRKFQ